MNNYLEHPGEEALERFLLHQSSEVELEVVETHILACDSCVSRLEILETEIAATKLALQEMRLREAARDQVAARQTSNWRAWFTAPRLTMAGAVAALALGIVVVPQFRNHASSPMAQVSLVAYRGLETPVVPKSRPLHVDVNASDITEPVVALELVNAQGKPEWHGSATVENAHAAVDLPRITDAGEHYLRVYAPADQGHGELLREFAFQVK